MPTKNQISSAEWTDPDDAPPRSRALIDQTEFLDGDRFVRQDKGPPNLTPPEEQIDTRLDADVLECLRARGRDGRQ